MTGRDSIGRVEAAVTAAGYMLRQRGADVYRTQGICHGARANESLVFLYNPDRGHINPHCHAFCDRSTVLGVLGLTEADLYDEPRTGSSMDTWAPRPRVPVRPKPEPVIFEPPPVGWRPLTDGWMPCGHPKTAEYLYGDWERRIRFGVCRCDRKCFAQWRPDAEARSGRKWRLRECDNRGNVVATVLQVPYMLPQLLAGVGSERTIWIVEGEKDCRALVRDGLIATCNAEGAGKWTGQHAAYLAGADVIIVADRDVPGRKHAEKIVETLMPVARSIEVVIAKTGKDASDHLIAGHTASEFVQLWEPKRLELSEVML
ncbi:MAG TPA: hypothetical protein VGX23_33770 [Actinocrinis sp.]|nr:hypothetical protein [Actinocrinis sp.]